MNDIPHVESSNKALDSDSISTQESSKRPQVPIIVEDLVDPSEESTVENASITLESVDADTTHHSLVEAAILDTTADLKEAIISEQTEPLNVAKAILSDSQDEDDKIKRKGNVQRSNSWKFSSDYKLSRSSQHLIETIEFDMEEETLNKMDPEEEEVNIR